MPQIYTGDLMMEILYIRQHSPTSTTQMGIMIGVFFWMDFVEWIQPEAALVLVE